MSDEEWDGNRFEPSKKWEGEDEDEVKDDWDKSDSDDEKLVLGNPTKQDSKEKLVLGNPTKQDSKLPKKNLKKTLQVKEAPLTEEEKIAEKLKQQKIEENANMQLLKDMVGLKENKIDNLVPVTKEDFEQFGKAIIEKISTFSSSEHYSELIENITKEICVDLKNVSLKKLKIHIEGLIAAKQKQEKMTKPKHKTKGIGVKMDLEKDIYGGSVGDGFDDMDDFM